jgi:methylmalonyl-CoA mutase
MFAGEGTPERTNRASITCRARPAGGAPVDRLRLGHAVRRRPGPRPDIYGKIGNSGVSIATLDDMKKLYSGFDLCAPTTSVSMTINGPAPMILAMFMNAAIDQQVEKWLKADGRWAAARGEASRVVRRPRRARATPRTGELPEGNDGLGLGLLGVSGDQLVDAETYARIKARRRCRTCAAPCRPTS